MKINHENSFKLNQFESLQNEINSLLKEYEFKTEFSYENTKLTQKLKTRLNKREFKNRINLTNIPFCTIDGETTKDFDDAVYAFKQKKDFNVMIAIADVAHYVKENSAIDIDARERFASIYYSGNCIPMLPAKLSDKLCSLEPYVSKLCINVSFTIKQDGKINNINLYPAVMQSKAKLTYLQVQDLFDSDYFNKDEIPETVLESIKTLRQISLILRKRYLKRGFVNLAIPEQQIILDNQNKPLSIISSNLSESHLLIENLMITTNEIVAIFFKKQNIKSIFRTHKPPGFEKIYYFLKKFNNSAFEILIKKKIFKDYAAQTSATNTINDQQFLSKLVFYTKKYFNKTIPENIFLQCMTKAFYDVENIGHFGLSSRHYMHFTSPIRRYPDLLTHRILREFWNKKHKVRDFKKIAYHCNTQERKIMEFERKIQFLHIAQLMKNNIKKRYIGIIINKIRFGIFVRLKTLPVDGLIAYNSESISPIIKNNFQIGDNILVELIGICNKKQYLNFEYVSNQNNSSA